MICRSTLYLSWCLCNFHIPERIWTNKGKENANVDMHLFPTSMFYVLFHKFTNPKVELHNLKWLFIRDGLGGEPILICAI